MSRRRGALLFAGAGALLFLLVWGGILLFLGDQARSTAYLRAMTRLRAAQESGTDPAEIVSLIGPALDEAGSPQDAVLALSAAWPVSGTGRVRIAPGPEIGGQVLASVERAQARFPRSTGIRTLRYDALLWAEQPQAILDSRPRRNDGSSSFRAEAILATDADAAYEELHPKDQVLLSASQPGSSSALLSQAALQTGDSRFSVASGLVLLLEGDLSRGEALLLQQGTDPLLLSYLAADRGESALALGLLSELPAQRVAEPDVLAWQADLLAFSGRTTELAPIYRVLSESWPGRVGAVAANAHIWTDDGAEQERVLREAYALRPDDMAIAERLLVATDGLEPDPEVGEADRLTVTRIHLRAARDPFPAFLALLWEGVEPDRAERAAYLGWHLLTIGDREGLDVLLERVPRAESPRDWGLVSTLSVASAVDAAQTLASLERLAEDGSWAAALSAARAYREAGDTDAASRRLEQARELLRQHYPLAVRRAPWESAVELEEIRILAESGQRVAARDRLDLLLQADPANASARELRRRLQDER